MKKIYVILILSFFFLCGCVPESKDVSVQSISVTPSSLVLEVGDDEALQVDIRPENATNKMIVWTIDNPNVAKVNNGVVRASSPGSALITATSEDGGKSASCAVTVNAKYYPVESVRLDKDKLNLVEGNEAELAVSVLPENASNKKVIWSSSKPSVASVQDGKVTAHQPGKATITVECEDGKKTASCEVNVAEKVFPVEGIVLSKTELVLVEGDVEKLDYTITPENATNKKVIWESSKPSVASIEDGTVTAVAPGISVITVKTEDGGKVASCAVNVEARIYPVESISLDKVQLSLVEGDEEVLGFTILPENATNKKVSWSSSEPSVASVENGKLTTHQPGKTVISVTTEDGGKSATCEVTVIAKVYPVEKVLLNKTSLSLIEGDIAILEATVLPENATNKKVIWSSSHPSVASVEKGKVTALAPGNAIITVTSEDGGKSATCEVTVTAKVYPVENISLNKNAITLEEGKFETLVAVITPSNATNQNVVWISSDPNVASVENGKVKALRVGTTTITVKTVDGGLTATCQVTVKEKSTSSDGNESYGEDESDW